MSSPDHFRIGDAERDRAAALLSEHIAEGRLTQPEFDERLDVAMKAKTAAGLEPLFRDLPGAQSRSLDRAGQLAHQSRLRANELTAQSTAQQVVPKTDPRVITALTISVALTWTVAALLYFQANFDHWTIFILPMVLSITLGKLKGSRH